MCNTERYSGVHVENKPEPAGSFSDMCVPEDSVTQDQILTENVRCKKKRSEWHTAITTYAEF